MYFSFLFYLNKEKKYNLNNIKNLKYLSNSIKETSVLLFICIGYVFGAPQDSTTEPIPILSQESNIEPDGSYQYKWV